MKLIRIKTNTKKGMTLFIAVVVSSILLFISFAVVNITLKGTLFTSFGRDSQVAFYAADAGLECALYWDSRFDPSKFDPEHDGSPINCGGHIITGGQLILGTSTLSMVGGGDSGSTPETISFVNSATGSNNTGSTFTNISTSNFNTSGGNLIVVTVRYFRNAGQNIVSVTDTASNSYVYAVGVTSTGGDRMEIWYAKDSNTHNSNVVTVNFSAGVSFINVTALQYSGIDKNSPLDATATGIVASGNVITSDIFNTTSNNQVIVSSVQIANTTSSWTPGSGQQFRVQTSPNAVVMTQDMIVSTIQTNKTVDASNSQTQSKSIVVASFKSGTSTGGPTGNRTSTFGFSMDSDSNPSKPCAIITITKNLDGSTYIKSRGYNTCDTSHPRRVERGVETTY